MIFKRILLSFAFVLAIAAIVVFLWTGKDGDSAKPAPKIESAIIMKDESKSFDAPGADTVADNHKQEAKATIRTMKFLELALQFVPEEGRRSLQKIIDDGVARQPDSFSKLGIANMELFGYLKHEGKLSDYYKALKTALDENPNDINLLRIITAVASIPSLDKEAEYERFLARLAEIDTHEDVIFPYAQRLLEKGDRETAYVLVQRTVEDHPEQAAEILTNSLRIFYENKAVSEGDAIANELKQYAELDPFRSNCVGDVLMNVGRLEDAEYFYEQSSEKSESAFLREMSDVNICAIRVKMDRANEQTIERLKDLSLNSSMPRVRKEARRNLILLNIDPPGQSGNLNQ